MSTTLKHRSYPPRDPDAPAAAPFLFVHGRGGRLGVMKPFFRAAPPGAWVHETEAPLVDPDVGGYCWWPGGGRGGEEAAAPLGEWIDRRLPPDAARGAAGRPVVVGFSQGAAVLSVLLQQDPARFAGAALLAGFVVPAAPRHTGDPATPSPVLVVHGVLDEVVPVAEARAGAARLRALGHPVQTHEDQVGHKVSAAGSRVLAEWAVSVAF